MEKISDTITSVFHIAIKDNRPAVCSFDDGRTVWGETFGLGWRFGISYDPKKWFSKGSVSIILRSTADKTADGLEERKIMINNFGHGQPALLGSWSTSDLAKYPYVSLTLTTKARLPQEAMDPLSPASLAIRRSMGSGDFVDTKFYVFSAKKSGHTAGRPRIVYANSDSIGLVLPNSASRDIREVVHQGTPRLQDNKPTSTRRRKKKQENEKEQDKGLPPVFFLSMADDHHINKDSEFHNYAYKDDSDLEDEDEAIEKAGPKRNSGTNSTHIAGSSSRPVRHTDLDTSEMLADLPSYSASTCRMILVTGVAYKTWASYIYFRYTGQISFLPLKSAHNTSIQRSYDPSQPPRCSPKSMFRLASTLGDERMKEIAFRAIAEGLSKNNVVEEALSWFTAQYPAIRQHEVDKLSELRKLPEISSALNLQLRAVSLGEKPWAHNALTAIMAKLNV